ncbi:TMEM175 family protein [Mucilaginibacter ginsenosidivorans]|uniref:DUF1211 domain-containing protein n=1 Tax=Mucilaginibacter ginsenosidivorans TaxID=398053 RepID=A0A5B8UXZ1_9SPHI|nr:TMEM175 family protein [Mucilaginibacter ginsenosidivorans]QEC64057.1 DUF1211 domain-containing protein [Mucilaginibacter ginsenosidivorans]
MSSELSHNSATNDRATARLEAFSDGIFAVAITLLALDISYPFNEHETNASLAKGLLLLWPKYFAYTNSFVTILLMWIAHHGIFKLIRHVNVQLIIANGFLMLLAVLTPFPTRVLGDYIASGAFKTAAVLYTGFFVLVSVAFITLWFVVKHERKMLHDHVSDNLVRKMTKIEFTGMFCNISITAVTAFNPWVGLTLNTAMWIYWLVKTK